jgi:hypothetical protein
MRVHAYRKHSHFWIIAFYAAPFINGQEKDMLRNHFIGRRFIL